ncbi:YciC family protein [Dickeya dianthicola]|uniref:YciC family protein n=1 Tax=Dickeya dianthicola TaxID=204039 RepID=UPI0030168CDE
MPITASRLYRDTLNFTRNQFFSILMLALLTSLITVVLGHVFTPGSDQLQLLSNSNVDLSAIEQPGISDIIQQLSPEQQMVLLKASAAGTFATLVGNALLTGGILMLIQLVSAGHQTSALRAIGASVPLLPRLFFLILVCTLLIQLGMLLVVVPGILLSIAFSLSPVIAVIEKRGLVASMRASSKLAFAHFRQTAPAVLLWLLAKVALLLLLTRLPVVSPTAIAVILNGISNVLSAMLLVYVFRLYMLARG